MTTTPKPVPAGWLSLDEVRLRLGLASVHDVKKAVNLLVVREMHWAGRRNAAGSWGLNTAFPPAIVAILADYLAGSVDVHEARRRLDRDEGPADLPVSAAHPEPPLEPEVFEEHLAVVSSARLWPNGQVSHFGQPLLIKARRPSGEVVVVRVTCSLTYTPKLRSGEPMLVRCRYGGSPRIWTALDKPPRRIGQW